MGVSVTRGVVKYRLMHSHDVLCSHQMLFIEFATWEGRKLVTTAASEDPVADTKGLSWALDLGVLFSHMKPSSQ